MPDCRKALKGKPWHGQPKKKFHIGKFVLPVADIPVVIATNSSGNYCRELYMHNVDVSEGMKRMKEVGMRCPHVNMNPIT